MKEFNDSTIKELKKYFHVNENTRAITAPKDAVIGLKVWSKIDYAVNYCGYSFERE